MGGPPGGDERTARLVVALAAESDRFVRRLRDFTASRYQAVAPPFRNRAAAVRHLAQQIADTAVALETPAGRSAYRRLPVDLPDLGLADVLAVTTGDVLLAATERADEAGLEGRADLLAALLAELLLHRWDVDQSRPGSATAGLAWPGEAAERPDPARFLAEARRRCPGPEPDGGPLAAPTDPVS